MGMEHNHGHKEHDHSKHVESGSHEPKSKTDHSQKQSRMKLSISATLHCLLGCGLGEVLGIIIGVALSMSTVNTIILAVILGFVFGFLLGIVPLLKAGFGIKRAFKPDILAGDAPRADRRVHRRVPDQLYNDRKRCKARALTDSWKSPGWTFSAIC